MVPKTINYCWFGNKEKNELVNKCIQSWKSVLPDYEIKEWNESNFDINCNAFVSEAYKQKKWAFVADYCRLYVLYNYGGIYLDTDVEVLKNFNPLLANNFLCFEQDEYICTAVLGFESKNNIIKEFMDNYVQGKYDLTVPNSKLLYNFLSEKYHLPENIKEPLILNDLNIFPSEYFSPKDFATKKCNVTKNTICIHHFDGTWKTKGQKFKDGVQNALIKILGKDKYYSIKNRLK